MYVVGTAGHVDHGKSTLVKALTGIDPDRLREEKERGMTIELGFAWLALPNGLEVSVVDVPGHERFIKNMLMGVGGIDVALLVVAADEGVMPQTREHLAIIDLLKIDRGVVALTKRELADPDWLELVSGDVAELLDGTSIEGAPLVAVSAHTGEGLEKLKIALQERLHDLPPRPDLGRPRLPVDRSFTIAGFGTVVTGTLHDGRLRLGQEIEILPSGLQGRVRGLQTHKKTVDEAVPGSRVAVNLAGINYEQIKRGDVLTSPGWLHSTTAFDVSVRVVPDSPRPVRHNSRLTLYTGASEMDATVRLLDANELKPGESGWAQVRVEDPLAIVKGDYFVLRDSVATLGGGNVVDPVARRHKRFEDSTIKRLAVLERGSEDELLISALESIQPATAAALATKANMSPEGLVGVLDLLVQRHALVAIGAGKEFLYTSAGWAAVTRAARGALTAYHRQYPLRPGMPREELRNRLQMKTNVFLSALAQLATEEALAADDAHVRLPGFSPALTREQKATADAYLASLATSPYTPPTDQKIDPEILNALAMQGKVVKANEDVVFLASAFEEMAARVLDRIKANGKVTVADLRDMFGQSRKYILALLEYMDRMQLTRRVGDDRVLR
ncbi:MAG: selenocysteine-specific translation elongation factor [Chloroflexi bacterium]|nr:selenocysteine-specific translation elongation factor [Chloroflexota bacterium]